MLSNYEARNQSHVFSLCASSPRARCLTLALPPNGGGPGSPLRFTEVTVGCPLATRARVGRLTTLERLCSNPPVLVARTPGARGSGIKKSAAIAGRFIDLLVASLLATANRHCVLVRLFGFRGREASPRPQQYHAQASSLGVPEAGVTEPTLALQSAAPQASQPPSRQVPCSHQSQLALRHCSACAR